MASSFIPVTSTDYDSDDSLSHYEYHASDEEIDKNQLLSNEKLESPRSSSEGDETKADEQENTFNGIPQDLHHDETNSNTNQPVQIEEPMTVEWPQEPQEYVQGEAQDTDFDEYQNMLFDLLMDFIAFYVFFWIFRRLFTCISSIFY